MNTKPRKTRRRNLSVTDADYARLQALGNGNASAGLREARRLVDQVSDMECSNCEQSGVFATDGSGPFDCSVCGKSAAALHGLETT